MSRRLLILGSTGSIGTQALDIVEHAYLMDSGRVVMSGPAEVVKSNPDVEAAYLGGIHGISGEQQTAGDGGGLQQHGLLPIISFFFVARMEQSAMRDLWSTAPGFRFASSGLRKGSKKIFTSAVDSPLPGSS